MSQMKTILFICTGNTCRSYMAETIGKDHLSRNKKAAGVQLISAGTGSFPDEPASVLARTVMEEMGFNLADHRAKNLTVEMVRGAQLVLTMTGSQKKQVLALVPEAAGKVSLLKEYALGREGQEIEKEQQNFDVKDPFGLPLEYYRSCALELQDLVIRAVERFTAD